MDPAGRRTSRRPRLRSPSPMARPRWCSDRSSWRANIPTRSGSGASQSPATPWRSHHRQVVTRLESTVITAQQAFDKTRRTPADVQVAEVERLHDRRPRFARGTLGFVKGGPARNSRAAGSDRREDGRQHIRRAQGARPPVRGSRRRPGRGDRPSASGRGEGAAGRGRDPRPRPRRGRHGSDLGRPSAREGHVKGVEHVGSTILARNPTAVPAKPRRVEVHGVRNGLLPAPGRLFPNAPTTANRSRRWRRSSSRARARSSLHGSPRGSRRVRDAGAPTPSASSGPPRTNYLVGQIVDIRPGEVAIGLKVRATFRKLREEGESGVIHYGYKFTPLDESGISSSARGPIGSGPRGRLAERKPGFGVSAPDRRNGTSAPPSDAPPADEE